MVSSELLSDDQAELEVRLAALADSGAADLILTTGGTGVGPRDSTPEATMAVCAKLVPGLGEVMRAKGRRKTARAVLSRAVAGVRGRTLIVNVPGQPARAPWSRSTRWAELLPHSPWRRCAAPRHD